jgi:ubiquinone/menaquinone biosynthesis C-methylase UbiE
LADRLKLSRYACRVIVVGLTALGLIVNRSGVLSNATLTEQSLVKGKPGSAAPILGWQAQIVYPGLQDLVASLKQNRNVGLDRFPGEGTTLYQRLRSHPEIERVFQEAMNALSRQANQHLAESYDFGRFRHLVDAGGGDGTNAIALARRYAGLRATVFDSNTVCAIARRNIDASGCSDRVSTVVGDFLRDPFPPHTDAILFCHILTIWSMDRNLQLLRKCWQGLPEGGSVIVFNMMADDDDCGPLSTALGSPYFLAIATGEGMLHAWKDYEQAMSDAGFGKIERVTGLPLNHGVLIGTKS